MRKHKLLLSVFGAILILSMLLTACQPSATPEGEVAEEPKEEEKVSLEMKNPDTFVVITGAGEPETLDPAWTYETAGSAVENNVYESVVWFDRERTDEFVPVLATSWGTNEAGDEWTFNIREGVTFHEGGTLEPHDIAYSMQRALLQDRVDGPHWMTHEAFFGDFSVEGLAKSIAEAMAEEEAALEEEAAPDEETAPDEEVAPDEEAAPEEETALYEETALADLPEDALVATCEAVKEAIVADDAAGTVTYKLAQPTPWFLAILANSFAGATYDMEWMVENGAWDGDCATWVNYYDPLAEDTILFQAGNGTGPYKLDHWIPGEEIVLVAFEDYWRTEPMWEDGPSGVASIPRVLIKNINEWGTRLAMFEAGDADYIYVPPAFRPQIEDDAGQVCVDDAGQWVCEEAGGYYTMYKDLPRPVMTPAQFNWQINMEGGNPFVGSGEMDGNGIPPDMFMDEHVRNAFNYCFDFDAMIIDALAGQGMQAQGPIIDGMMGYRVGEDPLFYYDPAKCEEEFKAAFDGELWDSGFYMQIAYNIGNETRRIASEIIKTGIEAVNPEFFVEVIGMPWPVLLNSRRAQKLPVYVGGWLEDFHDPHNWVHPFLHSQGAYGRVINMPEGLAAEFDALIEEAASYTNVAERQPIYEEIQLKAQEEAVVIWMYQEIARMHLQDWMKNWYFNPAYSGMAYSYVYALDKE